MTGPGATRRYRFARTLVVATVAAMIVTGCVGVPTGGPVQVASAPVGPEEPQARYAPAGPREGADPAEVVEGFLDAMLAYPVTTETAKEFLTDAAARSWRSQQATVVYDSDTVRLTPSSAASGAPRNAAGPVGVQVSAASSIRLDRAGRIATGPGLDLEVNLQRQNGEWRIVNPPSATLVTQRFFDDYFRAFSVYFFDRSGLRLVPELVHLPLGEQLPTALMTALASGPAVGAARRTYLPEDPRLRPSVPIDEDGVAEVSLRADVSDLPRASANRLAAQVVWTLRQAAGIAGVRIVAGGAGAGPRAVTPVDAWERFGPGGPEGVPCAVVDDQVMALDDGQLDGALAPSAGATQVACSASRVATLSEQGRLTVVARGTADQRSDLAVDAVDVGPGATMRWGPDDSLWVLTADAVPRLLVITADGVQRVSVPDLQDIAVDSLSVAGDGGRIAVTGRRDQGRRLMVLSVVRSADDDVVGLTALRVIRAARSASSVTWSTPTTLEFLDTGQFGRQIHSVAVDGSDYVDGIELGLAVPPDVDPRLLVLQTTPVTARWLLGAGGALWYRADNGSWDRTDIRATALGG